MLTITPRKFVNEPLDAPKQRAEAAAMEPAARQDLINRILVTYRKFRDGEDFIRRFHRPVNGGTHGRGQIGGLLGVSNAGKSFLLEHYVGRIGADEKVENAVIRRALFVNLIDGCTPFELAMALFRATGIGVTSNMGASALMDHTTLLVTDPTSQVELVVIDDAQYLLCSPNRQYVKQSRGFILGLAKAKTCNILLGGTEDVREAIYSFQHAKSQGDFPHHVMRPYDWRIEEEKKKFRMLLDSIDRRLPFEKLSGLGEPYLAAQLYRASKGALGTVMQYVKAAAFDAINQGHSHITETSWLLAAQDRADPSDPHRLFVDGLDAKNPLAGLTGGEEGPAPEVTFKKTRSAK